MSESEERLLAPTAHKLREARRRGEIPRGKELVTAVVTATGVLSVLLGLRYLSPDFAELVTEASKAGDRGFAESVGTLGRHATWVGIGLVGPFLLAVVLAAIVTNVVGNGGLVVSVSPVIPKLERLNPVQGVKRLFALRGLIELLKHVVKFCVVLAVAVAVLKAGVGQLVHLPACGTACVPGAVRAVMEPLVAVCCLMFLLFGLLDVGLQRWLFRRDQRMTRTEQKRDRKDTEGDPHLLSLRKKERRELTSLGAKTGMRHATFVVQAPSQTMAFRYAPSDTPVPILVARKAEGGAKLAAEARRRGVPVVFDPEAIQALGRLQIGKMVPKSAFMPVIRCMKAAGVIG